MSGDFDPHRVAVRTAQAEQVISHRAIDCQSLEQCYPRLRIDKAVAVKGTDLALCLFARVAEDQLEMRIRGNRGRRLEPDRSDVHAFMNGFEQPSERCSPSIHARIIGLYFDGGGG